MHRVWGAAGVVAALCAFVGAPGQAAAAQSARVIVAPKPGQDVTQHPVRFVVRAGPESGDLQARLNGVAVGRHFLVGKPGRRVLIASASHGLQHGPNVLKVTARRGARVRHATVRFNVAHQRPLTGAGRDRRIGAGSAIELDGNVVEHPDGPSGDNVRWELLHAPRGSDLRTGDLRGAGTLTPSLRPDVHGVYKLELTAGPRASAKNRRSSTATTAGIGSGATSDVLTLNAVQASVMVDVQTSVPGDSQDPRPGIKVGDQVYRAPYMRKVGGSGSYLGAATVEGFGAAGVRAYWQILMLDSITLEQVWNRTYGLCSPAGQPDNAPGVRWCRLPDNAGADAEPILIDTPADEILESAPNRLVIVSSHPATQASSSGDNPEWGRPNLEEIAKDYLDVIGLRDDADPLFNNQLNAAPAGGFAVIGEVGMKPGEADFTAQPVPGQMTGRLIPDNTASSVYHFVASQRVEFDTRSTPSSACDSGGACTITQEVGGTATTHTAEAGTGGFLVSVYEPHTLVRQDLNFYTTAANTIASVDLAARVGAMADFLKRYREAGMLVVITSVHTPGLQPGHLADAGTPADTWALLAGEVKLLGGTLHAFNTAASTPGSDYTLVGSYTGVEGSGQELVGTPGVPARLRGVLVPNSDSMSVPANLSKDGSPPAEQFNQIFLRAPSTAGWPLDNDKGASAAVAYIGGQIPQLGSDPRAAYWTSGIIDTDRLVSQVNDVDPPPDELKISSDDLHKAQRQLVKELTYVDNVREYLGHLAAPSGKTGGDAWEDATILEDELKAQLDYLKEQAKTSFNFLDFLEGLLQVATAGASEELQVFFGAAAAATELAGVLINVDGKGGSSSIDDNPRIQANLLGEELQKRADQVSKSFLGIGDVIVSDWSKLEQIGKYGGCVPSGCPANLNELAYTQRMQDFATAATQLALDRTLHEHLLPLSFAIWDTGTSYSCFAPRPCSPDTGPNPSHFSCTDNTDPFTGAPKLAWFASLEQLSPAGGSNVWRTWLSVANVNGSYDGKFGFAPDEVLHRMFDPVSTTDPASGGLGISQPDFMREAQPPYQGPNPNDVVCGWLDQQED